MQTIQSRVAVGAGLAVAATVILLTGFAAYSGYRSQVAAASTEQLVRAGQFSAEVKAELERTLNSAIALANAFSSVKASSSSRPLNREQVVAMLRQVVRRMPNALGVYTGWEPNAFDHDDSHYAGKPGYDASGRLLPYLVRNSSGEITLTPLVDFESQELGSTGVRKGEYYLCAKETMAPCILDPFPYPVDGKEVMMTSLIAPIVVDGRFYGIAGIDIQLGTLQQLVDRDSASQAQVALLSGNGRIVAAKNSPALAGKSASMYRSWLNDALLAPVLNGADYTGRQDQELAVAAPMRLAGTKKPWAAAVLTPYSSITASARNTALRMAGIGLLVGLIVVALTVLIVARGIQSVLKRAIARLSGNTSQVSSSSSQVAEASQVLAQGASEQAATIEETSASATEIHSMATRNAETARNASQLMKQSIERIGDANERLDRLLVAMDGIQESSNQISRINRTIDEIAFQTNILALNAAVEAARAGEAGMGFAVVADEVRTLAQRSAEAARETSGLIEKSIASYGDGRAKVDQVAEAIRSITKDSQAVRELVETVTRASDEQSRGIEQISQAIVQMEQVTQRNAAAAEECASASQEMATQVHEVNDTLAGIETLVGAKG